MYPFLLCSPPIQMVLLHRSRQFDRYSDQATRGTTEESRFDPRKEKRVLGVTKTRTHFAPGDLSPGLKRSASGAVHSSTLRSLRMSGAVPTLLHIFPWCAQWHLYISELPKIFCFLYATSHILQPKRNPIFSIFDNYCMLHVRVSRQLLPHF